MTDDRDPLESRVLDVLAAAEEPLSAGTIQRRLARDGFDATTGAVRDACQQLSEKGPVEVTDDPRGYRIAD